jgi:hypothetical protein
VNTACTLWSHIDPFMFDKFEALCKLCFCVINAGGAAERFVAISSKVTPWGFGPEFHFSYVARFM